MDAFPGFLANPAITHSYIYGLGNPLSYGDPSGLWSESPIDAAFLVADIVLLGVDVYQWSVQGRTPEVERNLRADLIGPAVDLVLLAAPDLGLGNPLRLAVSGGRYARAASLVAGRVGVRGAVQLGVKGVQVAPRAAVLAAKSYQTPEDAMRDVDNWNVDDSLKVCDEEHVDAAQREKRGEVVKLRPDGRPYNHIKELQDHWQHLQMVGKRITDIIMSNDRRAVPWDPEAIEYFRDVLGRVKDGMEWLDEALH